MNKYWILVFIAAVFEVFWVIGLKHATNLWSWIGTILCISLSFYLVIKVTERLPVGTAYAVFVGLGTAGTVLADSILFHEPLDFTKLFLIFILLIGVIGLKLVTEENQGKEEGL